MYTVQVKGEFGWTTHSEHEDIDDANEQADLVHGQVTDEGE